MPEWSPVLFGVIQGITEWIPLSSEGVVALAAAWIDGVSMSDAIAIALWLHAGTAVSAAIALRSDIVALARETAAAPRRISRPVAFLIVGTLVTAIIGVPLYLYIGEAADSLGSAAMIIVGVGMIMTGTFVAPKALEGRRGRDDMRVTDAVLAGAAQGIAVIPGVSRTAVTVAMLLARGSAHKEAVILSVLMGIPASLGAGLLAAFSSDMALSAPALLGSMTAAVVGMAAIRGILAWASRVRLAPFVTAAGVLVVAGALLGLLTRGS